ncbi:hypothetical protein HYW43_03720 [Candidatus Daviesbacteria bacterium]|nr:hypothetical protein [Candidatus Daviesbacteria bacterium]
MPNFIEQGALWLPHQIEGALLASRRFLNPEMDPKRRLVVFGGSATLALAIAALSHPERIQAENMVLADRLAWTSAQFGATDRRLGLLTLPDVLVYHDQVNRDELGIDTRAAEIAEEDNKRTLEDPEKAANWRSLGKCDALAAAGILDKKPASDIAIVLLIAYHRFDRYTYLTTADLGTEEGKQAEIDAQIARFLETRAPFIVEAPLDMGEGLWYRPVNGVSPDGQELQVGNFGKEDVRVRRDQIRFAYKPLSNPGSRLYIEKQIIAETIYHVAFGDPLPVGEALERIRERFQ